MTLEQYASERLLADSSVEEQVFRFLSAELATVAHSGQVSEPPESTSDVQP